MAQGTGAETGTRTIPFTDLVGSTALRSPLRDVAADKVRRFVMLTGTCQQTFCGDATEPSTRVVDPVTGPVATI